MDYEEIYEHLMKIKARSSNRDLVKACLKVIYMVPIDEDGDYAEFLFDEMIIGFAKSRIEELEEDHFESL